MELRLPTVAVPVRLALVGHEVTEVELFVADVARSGRGKLLDDVARLLDAPDAWLPIRGKGGDVRVLHKHAITWLALRRRESEPPSGDFSTDEPSEVFTLYDRQHKVEVELSPGLVLRGTLLDSAPADRPRLVDHLNRGGPFVRLWTTDEHYLINATQIVAVTELPEPSG